MGRWALSFQKVLVEFREAWNEQQSAHRADPAGGKERVTGRKRSEQHR